MECFRIDESGYTGFDLFNADQRYQGASAIAISNEEAAKLIKEYFPKLQAPELKYRSLSRRTNNRQPIIDILREIHTHHKCINYVCDKRYLLTLMFVDYAVEPFYYERGHDLYVDGGNYSMASLLYSVGPSLFGRVEFDELLEAFQLAVKEKSNLSKIRLISAARNLPWQELPEILGPLAQFASPDCWSAIATPGVDTDASFIVLQSLITRMEIMADGPYRVEHDRSKNLQGYNTVIQRFIDHDIDIEFRPTEIASMKFPLKLTKVTQVDSVISPAVQLADVMTGALVEAMNKGAGHRDGGLDPEELMEVYAEDQFINMLPSIDFEEHRRFRRGTQSSEMIDYFSANLF